jgi:phosphatidylserine decarboxylase
MQHQYIVRTTGEIMTEHLIADQYIRLLYHQVREHAPSLFRILTAKRMSGLLGSVMFDCSLPLKSRRGLPLLEKMEVNWQECVDPPHLFISPRHVFERKIRYWELRPMDPDPRAVVSPADARILFGSLADTPELFIKDTFFSLPELLGAKSPWLTAFSQGDFALFRLTPDKYHYNHAPVSGDVVDIYSIDGWYHSCNPEAVIALASLHAKNRRVVTIIDTDVPGGSSIGLVAMIEVVALMIGDIVQQYSDTCYDNPVPVVKGMRLQRGCPKSLYRPGSSTDILLFQKNAVTFAADLQRNLVRCDVHSRFSAGLGRPLVETDLKVRSTIAFPAERTPTVATSHFPVP